MLDMSGIPIYLLPGFSDLRRGINGFVSVITNIMEMDVTLGGLYIFCGRRRDSIKCVMWDKIRFLLLQKKLVVFGQVKTDLGIYIHGTTQTMSARSTWTWRGC